MAKLKSIQEDNAVQRETVQPEENKELCRLNLKFLMEYKEYLQEMGWRNRTSLTGYLTKLIRADMEKHPDWRTRWRIE